MSTILYNSASFAIEAISTIWILDVASPSYGNESQLGGWTSLKNTLFLDVTSLTESKKRMASQSKLSPAGHRFFEAKGVHRVPCSPAAFRSIFNPKRLDKKISCWSFLSSIPRYQIFPKVVPPRCVSLFLTSNYVDISTKNPSTSYSEYNGVLGENGIPPFMDCGIPIYIYPLVI